MRLAILLAGVLAGGAGVQADAVRFVACPIYRDTDSGRKSGCWLADDPADGTRYDVTAAPTKPDWNHAVLVEGRTNRSVGDPCGGTVLDPARVSVLEADCTRFMIGAEGYKGRRFALPERNVHPLYEDRARPAEPFVEGRFTIPFDFNSSFVSYQIADYYLDATINYALDVQPARIVIAGHAQTAPAAVSGMTLAEPAALARTRAEVVRRALILRGVATDLIAIGPASPAPLAAAAFDGIDGATERRVDVTITPLPR